MPISFSATPKHFVVVRLSAMGDVALLTGVLHHWWQHRNCTFTVVTKAAFAPLFQHHPAVREVISLHKEDLHGDRQREFFRQLAARFYGETLIDLHGTLRTRLLGCRWHGPVWRYPKLALARRLFLLSRGKFCQHALLRHNVTQRYWLAMPQDHANTHTPDTPTPLALRPQFFLSKAEKHRALTMLAPLGKASTAHALSSFPLVALHPFATHASKTWPLPVWQELATRLESHGIPYFWVGQDAKPHKTHAEQRHNFINRTHIRELLALLEQADMLVTGDSGPMHLAEGVGTPVVALFGPTCREWGFFPSGEHSLVLQTPQHCRPCSLHGKTRACQLACMKALSPADVDAAILGLWATISAHA